MPTMIRAHPPSVNGSTEAGKAFPFKPLHNSQVRKEDTWMA